MFDQLDKYKKQGNFFFEATDSLVEVCDAPKNKYGIFLAYALRKGRVELVYIGKSGFVKEGAKGATGTEDPRDLQDEILNGFHFGEIERKNSWPVQMMIEEIEALHIHWYVTVDKKNNDLPAYMKSRILQIYQGIYGKPPRWNSDL